MTNSEKLAHILKLFKLRDVTMYGHFFRVGQISEIIARGLGIENSRKIKIIKEGAFFHDVGKIFIPDNILFKEDKLNAEESEIMRTHVELGVDIISTFLKYPEITQIVAQHHERYDGSGYPLGLAGKEICVGARICAIADSFDTVFGGRCYCPPRTFQQTVTEINKYSGTQYDPEIIEAFNKCSDHIEAQLYTHLKHRNN